MELVLSSMIVSLFYAYMSPFT